MLGGDDERMATSERICVEECSRRVSFVYRSAGEVAVHDLTKHARHSGGYEEGTEMDFRFEEVQAG